MFAFQIIIVRLNLGLSVEPEVADELLGDDGEGLVDLPHLKWWFITSELKSMK